MRGSLTCFSTKRITGSVFGTWRSLAARGYILFLKRDHDPAGHAGG